MIGKAIIFFAYSLGSMFALSAISAGFDLGISFQGGWLLKSMTLGGLTLGFMLTYALLAASMASLFHLRSLGRIAEIGIANVSTVFVLALASHYFAGALFLQDWIAAITGGAIAAGLIVLAGSISHPFAWFQTWLPVRIIDEN